MFDIGFWELLLIGIVSLLVLGPERLPEAARTAGKIVQKIRTWLEDIKAQVNHEIDLAELRDNIKKAEIVDELRATKKSIEDELTKPTKNNNAPKSPPKQ